MNRTLPDFLIVGAAKAGTTAIHAYMSQHPDIFVPIKKETNFFAYHDRTPLIIGPKDSEVLRQLLLKNPTTSLADYEALFSGAKRHQRLGEASPRYLYYDNSPPLIKQILGDVKIIALLRNPIDRAYSHFLMNHQRGLEPEEDFATAIELESERINHGWGWDWHYMSVGRYAEQLQRYFRLFPAENIKIIFHDELRENVNGVLADLFRFVGVDVNFQADTQQRYKVASTAGAKDGLLGRLAFATETTWLGRAAQRVIPKHIGQSLHRKLQDFVSGRGTAKEVPTLNKDSRELAWQYVESDVQKLESLLSHDLTAWRPDSDSDKH